MVFLFTPKWYITIPEDVHWWHKYQCLLHVRNKYTVIGNCNRPRAGVPVGYKVGALMKDFIELVMRLLSSLCRCYSSRSSSYTYIGIIISASNICKEWIDVAGDSSSHHGLQILERSVGELLYAGKILKELKSLHPPHTWYLLYRLQNTGFRKMAALLVNERVAAPFSASLLYLWGLFFYRLLNYILCITIYHQAQK